MMDHSNMNMNNGTDMDDMNNGGEGMDHDNMATTHGVCDLNRF